MKFSESWLRTLVDPKLTSAELSHLLTMAGLEVEELDPVAPAIQRRCRRPGARSRQAPDADRLNVCQVDTGSGTPTTIVCGAPNVAVGLRVPCALPGANCPAISRSRSPRCAASSPPACCVRPKNWALPKRPPVC
jgi:phenylalanyl-tRNA synthetase beta chain